MPYEPASAAAACSWVGLIAAVWSVRDIVHDRKSRTAHRPPTTASSKQSRRSTYGICVRCSRPISLATLPGKPWTPVCIYCAPDI